jgi:hypothetical protein
MVEEPTRLEVYLCWAVPTSMKVCGKITWLSVLTQLLTVHRGYLTKYDCSSGAYNLPVFPYLLDYTTSYTWRKLSRVPGIWHSYFWAWFPHPEDYPRRHILSFQIADINPIGGISKTDLKSFIRWASKEENFGLSLLQEFLDAPPTAELEPITNSYVQVRLISQLPKFKNANKACRRMK